jgi:hypothetical protein
MIPHGSVIAKPTMELERTMKSNDERHAPVLVFQINVVAAHSVPRLVGQLLLVH